MTDKASAWARFLAWADEWLQVALVAAAVAFMVLWSMGSALQAGGLRDTLMDIGPVGFIFAAVAAALSPVLLRLFLRKPS
jgi:ATP phosphoribosyltransferase regulatory subunit HisZ